MSSLVQKYESWVDRTAPAINTYANHLIVIFAFSVPVLVEARRTSLVLILALFLIRGRIFRYLSASLRDPVVLSFTVYFLVHILWTIGTQDTGRVGESIHDAAFLMVPLLFSTFIDARFVPRITGAFLIGLLASVAISYGIYLELIPPMLHDGHQGGPGDPTPVYHHSHYGYMLAVAAALVLQRLVSPGRPGLYRAGAVAILLALVMNIFIIAGRSGYVIFPALLLAMPVLLFGRKAVKPFLAALIVISITIVIAYKNSETFQERVDTTQVAIEKIIHEKDYYSSLGGRVVITMHALTLASDHWLIGMGTADHTGSIQARIQQENSNLDFIADYLAHPHNEYMNALLQFGVLGLIAFLNIPFQLLRYRNDNNESRIMLNLVGLSILLYSVMDVMVIDLGMLLTIVVLVSAGLRQYQVRDASFEKFSMKQGGIYAALMLLFFLVKRI